MARALQGLAGATLVPKAAHRGARRAHELLRGRRGARPAARGIILAEFDWQVVFLPNLPVMALLLILGPRLLPEFRNPEVVVMLAIAAAALRYLRPSDAQVADAGPVLAQTPPQDHARATRSPGPGVVSLRRSAGRARRV